MQATREHIDMLVKIQRLQPGDALTGRQQILQDLVSVGFVRAGDGAVAITLDGSLWLAQNKHLLSEQG